VLNLVGGTNGEGYFHALFKTWDVASNATQMPAKSALSKKRGRIHFNFFKEFTDQIINSYEPHRRTWKGLHVYATDGDQYELPRTQDVLEKGYRGYPCANDSETHYPHMYVVHCYDVLGGVTKAFRFSNQNQEQAHALEIAANLEPDSLTLYDRLFFSKDLMRSHQLSGSFFLARLKRGGIGLPEIIDFSNSNKRNFSFNFEGIQIHLVKVVNPRNGDATLFATNLPRDRFKNKEIADLYALRWEVETSNRDMSHTLKVEQWHSHSINGILQEIFMALWLANSARIQMAMDYNKTCKLSSLFSYAKSNFKLILSFIVDSLDDLIRRRYHRIRRRIRYLLKISSESRGRRTRSYPRVTKKSRKAYPSASTIPRQK